jgi:predicted nuclease of predicted toxin-antitoxin system
MVEPVAALLNGRGHPIRRARDVGLADEVDIVIIDYALEADLIIVTFDRHFRSAARRQGARCLHIRPPERTARRRLREHYETVITLFWEGEPLVTLPREGMPRGSSSGF